MAKLTQYDISINYAIVDAENFNEYNSQICHVPIHSIDDNLSKNGRMVKSGTFRLLFTDNMKTKDIISL